MEKEREIKPKTYGVAGLIEWNLQLPTGSHKLPFINIHFTGGQITGYGVSPARYTTDDPYIQAAIETSPYFKKKITELKK